MLRFTVRRLLLLIPILIGLSILVFLWIRALPGSPAQALLGERATPQAIAAIRHEYGLDKPLHVQYWMWMKSIATLDFGRSYKDNRPVIENEPRTYLDAAIRYDLENLDPSLKGMRFQVNATNLLDEDGQVCTSNYCYWDEGRKVIASLRYRW